ncbi:MAG: gamma-glutamyltransferase [Pelagibacterales bacterium]|nr:gamma-glutamyltransferase [Pelagibacterales bacterium]
MTVISSIITSKLEKIMKKFTLFFFIIFLSLTTISSSNAGINLSDAWVGEPDSGFRDVKLVTGKKYMVSSASQSSSEAGAEILEKGGNAIDAAIATSLVLNVVEPHSSGIGGGGFLLYFDKKSGKSIYFNGRETAPSKAKSDMFLNKDGKAKEFSEAVKGGLSVGAPGLLKNMYEAHKKYGKLPWKDLFQPAIKIAQNGFIVSERFHNLSVQISYLKDFQETSKIYLKNGQPYKIGETFKNPELATTLTEIANNGIKSFYNGKIAEDIVKTVQNSPINPGYLSLSDLKNYRVKTGKLLCKTYRNTYNICTMPLPSGGVTLLQIMGILENFNLSKMTLNSIETVHLISEATRLAYADRNEYISDSTTIPLEKLLNKEYLKERASLINPNKAISDVKPGNFTKNSKVINSNKIEPPSTTHLSIVDAEGNAVAMTNSIEYFFGSALSVDGFLLNNQLTDFSLEPIKNGKKVANSVEPHKQPRSSMAPTFVFDKNNNLVMILGSPGGPRIIQFLAKTIINHLDFKLDTQSAIALPSFVVLNDIVELEKNRNITKLKSDLEKMGHKTKEIEIVSGINAISIDNGIIEGGADPRREGIAIGF